MASRRKSAKPEMGMAQKMTLKILSMYDRTTDSDAIIQELYHPNATFSDPWVEVQGREKVAAHFRVIPSFVSKSQATLIRGSMAGVSILTIDSKVTFRFRPFPAYMGCTFRMFTVIELQDQLVISHTDHWDLNTVLQNIPIVSTVYRFFRSAFGNASSHLINTFLPRTTAPPPHLLQAANTADDTNQTHE
ncbi:Aste57867_3283 [Aphanomyces stellatus]|uniref:Aste57867_3283 protein n=1 Tax=Aphanomyces stellatus TaxID=120398 RepID=A0A485KBT4_9STRA|nr:hypothetical protein As57867_003273 [Aphanomyces stellatus]VFT80454.1 Aste57867_3283 [Aphanomyces stellatus]